MNGSSRCTLDGKHSKSAARGAENRTAPVRLRRAASTARCRAARPVTFFVLPKKVTKETRACEGALRVHCAARGRGPACKLAPGGRSDRQALNGPRAPCAARRLRRQNPKGVTVVQSTEQVVNPLGDAAAVRGGSGAVPGALSERP